MFCKNQPFKTLFRQIDDFLIRHAETALRITSTLKKWLSSDVAVILVNVIPSELDDKAREVAIKALDKAIQQLVFLDRLRSPDLTTEQKVLMAIDHLKTLPKAVQNTCKLPQKQYGLKVDEMFNFKIVTDEKESIYAYADCGHFKGV